MEIDEAQRRKNIKRKRIRMAKRKQMRSKNNIKLFSHDLINPNNLIIDKENSDFIPFGRRCTSAIACNEAKLRVFSLPFDWVAPLFPYKIHNVLKENFNDFFPDRTGRTRFGRRKLMNKYGIKFPHYPKNKTMGDQQLTRRIDRFNEIMVNSKKKYFIYIDEDYFYHEEFRTKEFNDTIFNDMLNLEVFLKNKYENLDYCILYFNFVDITIPQDSKIIQIKLHSHNHYNCTTEALKKRIERVINRFRGYCGELLGELFN